MNTTLTLRLDEDTARRLVRFGAAHGMSMDDAVLNVLRKGLSAAAVGASISAPKKRFETPILVGAESLLPEEVVSAHDMLAWAEGETCR
jgi:plasmid stability protein